MSQPVNIETPEPCGPREVLNNDWGEKKEKRICTDDLNEWGSSDGLDKCCFTIVYYEKEFQTFDNKVKYLTNVTAIFFEGDDCHLRTNGEIMHRFHTWLLKSLPYGYIKEETIPHTPIINGPRTIEFYITNGGCFQKDANGDIVYDAENEPIPCNSDTYCCRYTKYANFQKLFCTIFR